MISWQDMMRFIRTISRLRPDEAQKQQITRFLDQKEVPWEQLILLAQTEGVAGLLHHHLSRINGIKIPESYRLQLASVYIKQKQNQIEIEKEAELISRQLERWGLSAIALQGLTLLELYEAPGLRPMGDMDILVKPEKRGQVMVALHEIGFRISDPIYPNILFKNSIWLDLHTHILNADRINSRKHIFSKNQSALWDRATFFFKSSKGLLKPDPVDNFILQAAHSLKHGYSKTIWLVDLRELLIDIVSQPDGWSKVIERNRYWRQERIIVYGLVVMEGTLGFRIPGKVKEELAFNRLGLVEQYLLKLRLRGIVPPGFYIALWFLSINGVRNKLKFLYETAFPSNRIMDQIYIQSPESSRFIRSIRRLIRFLTMLGNGIKQALLP